MSMYDLVAGDGHQRDRGALLLGILGNPDPGRFRDAWVEKADDGQPVIAIYTRNGGGNRECCCDEGDHAEHGPCTALAGRQFAEHPLHIRNADDDFDSTYATYYFRTPDEYRDQLAEIAQDPVDTSARWKRLIDAIGAKGGAR
jgi:hypothetical protein